MLREALRRNRLAGAILVIALLAALFFAVRLGVYTLRWSDPERRDSPVAGWMTPGYVANSWRVPRDLVVEALGLDGPRRITLEELAAETGVPLDTMIGEIEAAIAAYRAANP